ncbi:MAG: peptide-methionine (R)-S-oxide reductase MsrB [Cyanobacteria bacterium P01_F01_bin.3]
MKKRRFLQTSAVILGTVALSEFWPSQAKDSAATSAPVSNKDNGLHGNEAFEITKTEAEWREILSPEAFAVLRQEATEPPHSSPLDDIFVAGTYSCAGCALPLFSSETKFNSGTGWPSFYAPLENAVATSIDRSFLMTRTEVHCRRCGGHLGHVFEDGPKPTGLRYCMNGIAMSFTAA